MRVHRIGPWAWGLLLVSIAGLLTPARSAAADGPATDVEADARAVLLPLGFRTPPRAPLAQEGLRWLASVQDAQGGWSARIGEVGNPAYDVGVTALVVSAFLGAGYTPDGPEPYGSVVARGIQRLLKAQDPDGRFGGPGSGNTFYNHAYGALAIVEAYAMTGSKALYDPAERAVAFVRAARNPYFAWRYGVKPGDNDTSMTGAMCGVLAAARAVNRAATTAGLSPPFPSDEEEWDGAIAWIDKMTDPDLGRVGYRRRGEMPARMEGTEDRFPASESECPTAIGLLLRIQQGARLEQPAIARGQGLCSAHPPTWAKPSAIDLCYWYFASQAMYLLGGASWTKWKVALDAALARGAEQRKEGTFWPAEDAWGSAGGGIYTTAMAVLCLETEQRCQWTPGDTKRLLDVAGDAKEAMPFRVRALQLLALRPRKGSGTTLKSLLSERSKELRLAAVAAVGGLGAEGCPLIADLLGRDPDDQIRVACVRALGASHAKIAAAPLMTALRKDASSAVRLAAARALGDLPEAMVESTPALEAATSDTDSAVAAAARETLERSKAPGPRPAPVPPAEPGAHVPKPLALGDLESVAAALESEIRWPEAAARLREQGAAALPTLLTLVKHERGVVRARALRILVRLLGADAEQSVSILLTSASDPDPLVRAAAVDGLGTVAQPTAAVRTALRAALADPESIVAKEALDAIGRSKTPGPEEAQAIGKLLSRDSDELAVSAARRLGEWALGERQSTDALLDRLGDRRPALRTECIRALFAVAAKDPRVLERLATLLSRPKDPDFSLAWILFEKLGPIGAGPIAKRLADTDAVVRMRAELHLEGMGSGAVSVIPDILDAMAARPFDGFMDGDRYAGIFVPMGKPGLEALFRALKDPRADLRAGAAAVLGAMDAKARSALGPLGRAKTYEKSEAVRKAIDFAIYQIQRALK